MLDLKECVQQVLVLILHQIQTVGWMWPHIMCSVLLCKECIIIYFFIIWFFSPALGTVHWPCITWQRSYNHPPFCLLKWSPPIQISSLRIRICHEPGFVKKVSLNFPFFYWYKCIMQWNCFMVSCWEQIIAASWYRFVVSVWLHFLENSITLLNLEASCSDGGGFCLHFS